VFRNAGVIWDLSGSRLIPAPILRTELHYAVAGDVTDMTSIVAFLLSTTEWFAFMRLDFSWTQQRIQTVTEKVRAVVSHLDCIVMVSHVDECKSPWPARLVVVDNLHLINCAVMFKHLTQVTLLSVQAQTKHPEAPARLRILLKHTHTHTAANGHYPAEPGFVSWLLDFSSFSCSQENQRGLTATWYTGQLPFLSPNQQCQSTEWIILVKQWKQQMQQMHTKQQSYICQ